MATTELITSGEAALLVGKDQRTIARWRDSGRLTEVGKNWRGWALFRRSDVMKLAEIDRVPALGSAATTVE